MADGHWRVWFAVAAGLYVATTLMAQGAWMLSGAMWAEMATNYYPNAHATDWSIRLFSTDSGYWPMPQRLVALIGALLGLSARATPYYYNGASLLIGGLLVASFCHRVFRCLIGNDRTRFVICAAFCLIPDFQTRTFINFTYLGFALLVPLSALALIRPAARAPAWSWAMPLLLLSKPVFLALVPAMMLGAIVGGGRLRRVMTCSVICGLAQLARLATSGPVGDNFETFVDPAASLGVRLVTAIASGTGMLAEFAAGPSIGLPLAYASPWILVVTGAVLTGTLLVMLALCRSRPVAGLVLVGLSAVYAVALLNSFALSAQWTLRLDYLTNFATSRWSFGAIVASIYALFGTLELMSGPFGRITKALPQGSLPTLPFLWLIFSGWGLTVWRAVDTGFPLTGSSYWIQSADLIDAHAPMLCVPADPYQSYRRLFMYRKHCVQLNNGPPFDSPAAIVGDDEFRIPASVTKEPIVGMIVVLRPAGATNGTIRVRVVSSTAEGVPFVFEGRRTIDSSGGIVLLSPGDGEPVRNLVGIKIQTDPPTPILENSEKEPAVIFLRSSQ